MIMVNWQYVGKEGKFFGMNLNLSSIHFLKASVNNEEFRLNRLDLFYPCQISTGVWV